MKKRLFNLLLIMFTISVFSGCGCEHEWEEATCTTPKTCTKCGDTEGEALGHVFNDATCILPKTCSVCNTTEGSALGHTWIPATCTEPERCSNCGETKGEALGHTVTNWKTVKKSTCEEKGKKEGVCSTCGETLEKELKLKKHTPGEWEIAKEATLDEEGTKERYCKVCFVELDSKTYELSAQEKASYLEDSYESYSYNTIARDPDSYKYKSAKFTGEVIQVMEDGDDYTLRVDVTKTRWGYDDTILVTYTRKEGEGRILEDDIITLYGTLGGTYTYESVLGASITVPLMFADYVRIH